VGPTTLCGIRRLATAGYSGLRRGQQWVACGPGMALAWSYQYFLLSFARSRTMRRLLTAYARTTGFWLKFFDGWIGRTPAALDACSGCYFLGRKTGRVLSDRELIDLYRGAV